MPTHLESLNNYPTWYTDYGESPTSTPPTSRDIIYDAGYDPDKVMEDYSEMFEDYDPTREQFAQDRLQSQEQSATLNYEQNVDQLTREQALMQAQLGTEGHWEEGPEGTPGRFVEGKKGFLGQALDRQRASLAIQQSDTLGAQQRLEGYTDPETGEQVMGARQIAGEQVGIQRGLTQAEQGFAEREFGIAGRRLGLQEEGIEAGAASQIAALGERGEAITTEEAEAIRRAGSQEAGVGREEERLALAEAGAGAESQFALGRLGREREELGLQERQAQLARSGVDLEGREIGVQRQLSDVERSEIGMQRDISDIQRGRFGLQRETSALEQQEAQASMTQLQAQMGQQVAGARRGMMQAYQAGEADTSGFAGAGARDVAQQRAIQGYAGDAAAGIQGLRARGESLRRGMERFDIAGRGVGLEEQAFDVGAGRFGLAEQRLDIGAGRYDIAEERLDLRRGGLDVESSRRAIGERDLQAQESKEKDDLKRQLDQYDVTARDLAGRRGDIQGALATQQQRFGQQRGTIGRQVGEVAATEARQLGGVALGREAQQAGYDRRVSQLGGQLSGYDLQDASDRLRFDEQGGRLRSQSKQLGIQGEGALARFQEQRMGVQSRLGGIGSQLGEGGFLQRGLQNTLGQLGGRFGENVYDIRDRYGDETRNRILDLIRDEGIDKNAYGSTWRETDLTEEEQEEMERLFEEQADRDYGP